MDTLAAYDSPDPGSVYAVKKSFHLLLGSSSSAQYTLILTRRSPHRNPLTISEPENTGPAPLPYLFYLTTLSPRPVFITILSLRPILIIILSTQARPFNKAINTTFHYEALFLKPFLKKKAKPIGKRGYPKISVAH
jgi:hypothetical protein